MADIHNKIQPLSIGRRTRLGDSVAMSTPLHESARWDPGNVSPYDPALYHATEQVPTRQGWCEITDELLAEYRERGCLAFENVFTAAEVAAAAAALRDLTAGTVSGFGGVMFEAWAKDRIAKMTAEQRHAAVRKVFDFTAFDARLRALEQHPTSRRMVARLLGEPPLLAQEMALLKPPRGREKPWHQDHAYFDYPVGTPVVGVWIALDDATPENGCMRVVPGSHRAGPRVHFQKRDWQVCDTDILGQRVAAVPLRAGGCLLFDGLLLHGTPANRSACRREALQFHYVPASARKCKSEERLAMFGAEGKNVTC
jgi:phytanoyl-CoA hydroxylase